MRVFEEDFIGRQEKAAEKVLFVSFGRETDAARHYYHAAAEDEDAHMIHYGESSFATVFTKTPPVEDTPRQSTISRMSALVIKRGGEETEAYPDEDLKAAMVNAVSLTADNKGIDTEGSPFYLSIMSREQALSFADAAQADLERIAAGYGNVK